MQAYQDAATVWQYKIQHPNSRLRKGRGYDEIISRYLERKDEEDEGEYDPDSVMQRIWQHADSNLETTKWRGVLNGLDITP
jgi:hypothetical protein